MPKWASPAVDALIALIDLAQAQKQRARLTRSTFFTSISFAIVTASLSVTLRDSGIGATNRPGHRLQRTQRRNLRQHRTHAALAVAVFPARLLEQSFEVLLGKRLARGLAAFLPLRKQPIELLVEDCVKFFVTKQRLICRR